METGAVRDENVVLSELTPIFRKVFSDDTLVIKPETKAGDVAGWDSLSHMQLILAIEQHYKMRFKLSDVVKFKNVGDLCRAILKAGR